MSLLNYSTPKPNTPFLQHTPFV